MLRKLVFGATGAAILLGVLMVPASAVSPPTVLEINALPNTKIEICSAGVEVRNIRYGRAARPTADGGVQASWTVRKAAVGNCKGQKLLRFRHTFEDDQSYTVIYWKDSKGPRTSVIANESSTPEAGKASLIVRHVAHSAAASIWVWQKVPTVAIEDDGPTMHTLGRGTSSPAIEVEARDTVVVATPRRATPRWQSASGSRRLGPDRSYQALIMGDRQSNMKIRVFALDG